MTTPYGPPYGGYPAGPPPAMGRLLVHTSHSAMAFGFKMTGPRVTINGQSAKARWGEAPFDLPAGNYQVRVATRYLIDFGAAELPVAVYPGQQTVVYYRAPAMAGLKGAIGFTPQQTRGMAVFIAIQVMIFVIVFFVVLVFMTR